MSRRRPNHDGELREKVVGQRAAHAVLTARPHDVLSIAHSREARYALGETLRQAARHHIAYRELPQDELDRLAETVHHEGICLLVRAAAPASYDDVLESLSKGGIVVALDGVDNPHNVGAILRSAAFFGVRALIVTGSQATRLTPAMTRVAEGGAEHLPVLFSEELAPLLEDLADRGADVLGADAHDGRPVGSLAWSEHRVLVLGSERDGLAPRVRDACTGFVRVAGSGAIESLNVSVAAGVLLSELTRFTRSGQ